MARRSTFGLPRHVNRFMDIHDKERFQLRVPGRKKITLPGPAFSPAFTAAYNAAMGLATTLEPAPVVECVARDTMAGLVERMKLTPKIAGKDVAKGTRDKNMRILNGIARDFGNMRVMSVGYRLIAEKYDAMAGETPVAADAWRKMMRRLFALAIREGLRTDNPADAIERHEIVSEGHHTWTPEEAAQYLAHWQIGTRQELAFRIFQATAARCCDVRAFGPQHVGSDDMIRWTQQKTGNPGQAPMTAELRTSIAAAAPKDALVWLLTEKGRPFTEKYLSMEFARWAREAGLDARCTAHGVRKLAAVTLANSGGTEAEIGARLGDDSGKEVDRYTKRRDREKLVRSGLAKVVKIA
jgi:integrase/recombinase XerD